MARRKDSTAAISRKRKILKDLLELTDNKCLLSLKPESSSDKMTFHHITKEFDGGDISYINGAPLLHSNHNFLNVIEVYDNNLYCELNYAFDCMKETLEMGYVLSELFPEVSKDENSEQFIYDTSLDEQEIENIVPVEDLTAEQLIELKKAVLIYANEVIPAFQTLKEKYNRAGVYPNERGRKKSKKKTKKSKKKNILTYAYEILSAFQSSKEESNRIDVYPNEREVTKTNPARRKQKTKKKFGFKK